MKSLRNQIAVYDYLGGGQVAPARGPVFFADGSNGATNDTGKDWNHALSTMDAVFDKIEALPTAEKSNGIIYATGDFRDQGLYAPLGAYGWKIIGVRGGRNRHTTSSGTVLNGNGAAWREAATAAGAPLLKLREQGWEIHNFLMMPESGYSAVQMRCAEDATDPDASHATFQNVRFISSGTRVGYGIEDIGGAAHIGVYGCEFTNLEYAWKQTSLAIRSPQDHQWFDNRFNGCKTDIAMNATRCEFRRNRHMTAYDGTNHPTTLNLASTGGDGGNWVIDCEFADAIADVTIAKGYKPGTGDVWRTRATDTAADDVTVPS